ncbi:glycosyltransferase family 2 protein [Pseudobutyrivibrio sp. MD2005]|uniref:glycosyltransferase family 2 protein n=1 Tax=Pseudobutyrivibrio sp. MD2005 TaxID=1410616 RepID=UPI000485CE89|nr:glycosyltransferase [Pseudobutyrivibrio sp. MD2005]
MIEQVSYDISIIIPVYNAKKTIERCIKSVLEQECRIEVVIVDDESKDNTKEIIERLQKKYDGIRYYYKKNGGVASARNYGLCKANGKYVTFVDQDDWLENNTYSSLIYEMERANADVYVFGYSKDYDDKSIQMKNNGLIPDIISDSQDIIKYAFYREEYRNFAAFVWNKIFRKSFLMNNNIYFDESLKRGDDVIFTAMVSLSNPYTLYNSKNYYHYYQRTDSITHTYTNENYNRLKDILLGYEKAINMLESGGVSMMYIDYMKCFYVYHASLLLEWVNKQNNVDERKYLIGCIRKYYEQYCAQNFKYPERIERIDNLIGQKTYEK